MILIKKTHTFSPLIIMKRYI